MHFPHPFRGDRVQQEEKLLESVADQHRDADQSNVKRKGVNGVGKDGLPPCGRLFPGRIDSALLQFRLVREAADIGDVPVPCRPVDEPHADDDSENHAGCCHRETKVLSRLPVQFFKGFR